MDAATLPWPAPPSPADTDEAFEHAYCCDETSALCGADLSDDDWEDVTGDLERPCPMCETVRDAGLPCGIEGCPRA